MAKWKLYDDIYVPQCTCCGMWMPFARYRRSNGINAREITDYCPSCGAKMTEMPMCQDCSYSDDGWKEDGICYACRDQVWVPDKPHIAVGNEL